MFQKICRFIVIWNESFVLLYCRGFKEVSFLEMKKLSYEELEGKEAVIKSSIFVLDFKVKKMQEEIARQKSQLKKLRETKLQKVLELKDIKEAENWSISELDDAIVAIEKEIENLNANAKKLEADNKKLREFKLQKIFDEQKKNIWRSVFYGIEWN